MLLAQSLFEEDISFLRTHARGTDLQFEMAPQDPTTGKLDYDKIKLFVEKNHSAISALVFPQVNSLGLLEEVDFLADLARQWNICLLYTSPSPRDS